MSINGINGGGFNPYARSVVPTGTPRPAAETTAPTAQPTTTTPAQAERATPRSIADAIKADAGHRAAQINSAQAPEGVDQDLWSVLTKDERAFFVKAGAMGPLTYGRFTQAETPAAAPIVRGGRLDIRA